MHNILRDTRQFVGNVIGRHHIQAAMHTAKACSPGVNELEAPGLAALPSTHVASPGMKDALGWIEVKREEDVLNENLSLPVDRVVRARIRDRF